MVNRSEFRDLSPKQIVPRLADHGEYLASESTLYRILREEKQLAHREPSRPRTAGNVPTEWVASGPSEVYTWDITYLRRARRGTFYYLYMVEDLYSRKIMGWDVHEIEDMELSSALIERICREERIDPETLVLHSDNGGPMKGSTMLATLQRLGIVASFSRPRVSDDNPYSEALFRTLKYRPEYPRRPFASLEEARTWVAWFVKWYNEDHLHSGLNFVSPEARHTGFDAEILEKRTQVYEEARRRHPERWSRGIRDWSPAGDVILNPEKRNAA